MPGRSRVTRIDEGKSFVEILSHLIRIPFGPEGEAETARRKLGEYFCC